MGAYPTLGRMLFNLRLISGAHPGALYHVWEKSRVHVRHLTDEEKLLAALTYGAWPADDRGRIDYFTMFPPTPHDPVEGVILVPYGPVRFEQPVKQGEEREAVALLKKRMRGEVAYQADFHGLFRTTKPNTNEEGSTNDVPNPPVKPIRVRSPRKPKGKLKRGHR